jgi:hypothetical protein
MMPSGWQHVNSGCKGHSVLVFGNTHTFLQPDSDFYSFFSPGAEILLISKVWQKSEFTAI